MKNREYNRHRGSRSGKRGGASAGDPSYAKPSTRGERGRRPGPTGKEIIPRHEKEEVGHEPFKKKRAPEEEPSNDEGEA